MPAFLTCALNSLLPGSGLVLRRRLVPGLSLLIPALVLVSAGVIGTYDRDDPALQVHGAMALVAYLVCSVLAAVAWWWSDRPVRIDQVQVQALYRAAATAYLQNQLLAADQACHRLTRLLPNEAGSWRLLELVARARGSLSQATAAGQRAKRLDTVPI
jgi:hypothetical protein